MNKQENEQEQHIHLCLAYMHITKAYPSKTSKELAEWLGVSYNGFVTKVSKAYTYYIVENGSIKDEQTREVNLYDLEKEIPSVVRTALANPVSHRDLVSTQ